MRRDPENPATDGLFRCPVERKKKRRKNSCHPYDTPLEVGKRGKEAGNAMPSAHSNAIQRIETQCQICRIKQNYKKVLGLVLHQTRRPLRPSWIQEITHGGAESFEVDRLRHVAIEPGSYALFKDVCHDIGGEGDDWHTWS